MCQNANQVRLGQHTCQAVLNPKLGPDGGQGQGTGQGWGEQSSPHAGGAAGSPPLCWPPRKALASGLDSQPRADLLPWGHLGTQALSTLLLTLGLKGPRSSLRLLVYS